MKIVELNNSVKNSTISLVMLIALLAFFYFFRDQPLNEPDVIFFGILLLYAGYDLYRSFRLRGINLIECDDQTICVYDLLTKRSKPILISEIKYLSLIKNRCQIHKTSEIVEVNLVNATKKGKNTFVNKIYPSLERKLEEIIKGNPSNFPYGVIESGDNLVISYGDANQFMSTEHLIEFINRNRAWKQKQILVKVGEETKSLGSILNAESIKNKLGIT